MEGRMWGGRNKETREEDRRERFEKDKRVEEYRRELRERLVRRSYLKFNRKTSESTVGEVGGRPGPH